MQLFLEVETTLADVVKLNPSMKPLLAQRVFASQYDNDELLRELAEALWELCEPIAPISETHCSMLVSDVASDKYQLK